MAAPALAERTAGQLAQAVADGAPAKAQASARAPAVQARGLTVRLRRERHRIRSLREYFVESVRGRLLPAEWFEALSEVDLRVDAGGLLAVIGANGAGKTTLLRALAGIVAPSSGTVAIRGRVAPLLELGAGFDPELTGRENVFLFGVLLGRRRRQLREAYSSIVDFCGLADAMDVAIKNYSSGMVARLGFAVATACAPDVLLVDEVLAVGDEAFRVRCSARIADLRAGGTAIVLVSHDLFLVEREADRAVWLDAGRVVAEGAPSDVVARYRGQGAPR
ncbi:MAG: ABC transporter ATP-binding protein [Deltaproteobacteria bacterium]|nr:ABC transporter ATP-binding protein [Deltaproteobacteria bacterium]